MEKITHQHLDDDEIVIDFRELFYEFKRRIWWILLAAVLGTGAAGAYSYYLLTPQYISEAKIYVLSKETTLTSLADLQMGTQLTQDYKELIGSRPVMQEVINTLNLDITYRQLAEKLKLENPKDTRILYLTVTDPNPYMAKAIVDEIANAASDYIGEIMEMTPPKLIEDGMVATVQTSPNVKKNAAVGGLVMLVLACGVITLSVIMNDTIRIFGASGIGCCSGAEGFESGKKQLFRPVLWKKEKSVREARLQEKDGNYTQNAGGDKAA